MNPVDARATEETGEAGIVIRAEDLPELTRCADTAEQLGALRETLRIDATEAASEASGGFRASEFEVAVSMYRASDAHGPPEITPSSAIYGEDAPMVRPHPGVAWGQGLEMKLGLPGGADRPPQPAAPESDFHAVYSRLRDLTIHYNGLSEAGIAAEFKKATKRVTARIAKLFKQFGGKIDELPVRSYGITRPDQMYVALQEMARRAEVARNRVRAGAIRSALDAIRKRAANELQVLCRTHNIAEAPSTRAMQRPPATIGPTVAVTAIQPPARTPVQSDWITSYRQLYALARYFSSIDQELAYTDFHSAAKRAATPVVYRYKKFVGHPKHLLPLTSAASKPELAYRAIEDIARRAADWDDAVRIGQTRKAMEAINGAMSAELRWLTAKYGPLDALSTQATQATQAMQAMQAMQAKRLRPMQLPSVTGGSPVTVAWTTVALAGRLDIRGPAHHIAPGVTPAFPQPTGGLAHTTGIAGLPPASSLPGPSLSEAGGLEPARLDQPATTAEQPTTTEATVTPALAGTSSFWLQPVEPGAGAGPPFPSTPACTTPARPCIRLPSPPPRAAPPPFSIAALRSPPLRGWTTTSTSSAPSAPAGSPRGSMRRRSSPRPARSPISGSPTSSPRAGSPY